MTEFTVDLKAFAGALAAVSPVLNAAVKIPAYQHLHVALAGGRLTLSASDLDMEARATIDAKGVDQAFLMPRPVTDFLSARAGQAPAEAHVTVSDGAREIVATHGRARIVQPGLPAEDFVHFNGFAATMRFTLRAGELAGLLKPCFKAIAESDSTRAYLEGAFLHPMDGDLRVAASDGNVLHAASATMPELDGDWPAGAALPGIILPRRAVERIVALIDGLENEVAVATSPGFLSIAVGDAMLFTRLIAANFPDYTRIIPPKSATTITFDGEELTRAVKALAVVPAAMKGKAGTNQQRTVRLVASDEGVNLTMRGDSGLAEDFVAAEAPAHASVAFGARYLENAVAAVGGGRVRMTAGAPPPGATNIGWIVEKSGGDGSVFVVVSPRGWSDNVA